MAAGAAAIIVGYEGRNDDANSVYNTLKDNALKSVLVNSESGENLEEDSSLFFNKILQTGIGNPRRVDPDPYAGVVKIKPWPALKSPKRALSGPGVEKREF